jgi:hypothetical protein
MFLREKTRGHLVEVLKTEELFDPVKSEFTGRLNYGEDLPDPQMFKKSDVEFPSGEPLPRCWTDVHYRDSEIQR